MATRILVFDPLNADKRGEVEKELDSLLFDEYSVVASVGASRPGSGTSTGATSFVPGGLPKDYVVLVLYKHG